MASNFRRLKRAGIHIIPRVLLGIIWSLILHLLLAFTIPWIKIIKEAFRKVVRGIWLLRVRKPWSARLRAWPSKPSLSLVPDRSSHKCSSRCLLSILFDLQPKFLRVFFFIVTLVEGSDLLRNEDLRRQRVNGKKEKGVHRTWWWGRSMITRSTLRGVWEVHWRVGTSKRRVQHFFFVEVKVF